MGLGIHTFYALSFQGIKSLGCWTDYRIHALKSVKSVQECLDGVLKENKKVEAKGEKPYVIFGVQVL